VSGLVGYLMSLPLVRQKLNLDDTSDQKLWPQRMKKLVRDLAVEGFSIDKPLATDSTHNNRFLIAYNGVFTYCGAANKKRDDIPGDPLPQTTSTVCIQAPLQHLEECRLTIVLAPSRCL
jgi:hypothetical protein